MTDITITPPEVITVTATSPTAYTITVTQPAAITVTATSESHLPVTIGTANGMSLAIQTLSLGLASAGVTGALSGTDWTTFNAKEPAITILQASRGGTGVNNSFNLTVSGTSTINGSLVGSMTGGGTVATGGFTLTAPATGTAMLGTVTDAFIPRSNAGVLQAGAIRDNGSEIAIGTTINTAVQFSAARTSTATSGSALANNTVLFANPSTNSSASYQGIQLSARTSAVAHNFTGSLTGGTFNTIHTGSGTLTNQYAGRFQTQSTGGGVSTNAYAINILASTISGVGSAITNNYGVYIGNIVGSTLSYAIYTNTGLVRFGDVVLPAQATTAAAPAYVKGGMYFDTTLNKLRIGGATAWETVTSS